MPIMSSFAVFVERPPKSGQSVRYTVLAIEYHHSTADIERMIADYLNEKLVKPIPAGLTHYMIFTTDTAQSAANQAKEAGLSYKSRDDVLRMRAETENNSKFASAAKNPDRPNSDFAADPVYSDEDIAKMRSFCDALDKAFGGYKTSRRYPS